MAREDRRKKGGRTTPKGGIQSGARHAISKGHAADTGEVTSSTRYTAPSDQNHYRPSPLWVPALMFLFLIAGCLVILLNYMELLPGATDNKYLLAGLGSILAGIITATQFR